MLDIGMADEEDTCCYPDEGMYLHKQGNERRAYQTDGLLTGCSPEPNL